MGKFNLGFYFATGFVFTGVLYGIMYMFAPKPQYRQSESLGQQLSKRDFTH